MSPAATRVLQSRAAGVRQGVLNAAFLWENASHALFIYIHLKLVPFVSDLSVAGKFRNVILVVAAV